MDSNDNVPISCLSGCIIYGVIGLVGSVVGIFTRLGGNLDYLFYIICISIPLMIIISQKKRQNIINIEARKKKEKELIADEAISNVNNIINEENDKKYRNVNVVINCPACNGSGSACFYTNNDKDKYEIISHDTNMLYRRIWDPEAAEIHGDHLYQSVCPFCEGNGRALARIENSLTGLKDCVTCNGTGKVTKNEKLDIGVGAKDSPCEVCGGIGKVADYGIAYIKTQYNPSRNGNYDYDLGFNFNISGDNSKFFIIIDDNNKDMFSKYKLIE